MCVRVEGWNLQRTSLRLVGHLVDHQPVLIVSQQANLTATTMQKQQQLKTGQQKKKENLLTAAEFKKNRCYENTSSPRLRGRQKACWREAKLLPVFLIESNEETHRSPQEDGAAVPDSSTVNCCQVMSRREASVCRCLLGW